MSKSLEEIRRRYATSALEEEAEPEPLEQTVEEEMADRIRRRLCPVCGAILQSWADGYGCPRCNYRIFNGDSDAMALERALQKRLSLQSHEESPPQPPAQLPPSKMVPTKVPAAVAVEKLRTSGAPVTRGRWFKDKDVDGDPDALLQFGKHSGQFICAMSQDRDGRSYLEWMLAGDFSPDLKDIVKFQLAKRRLR